MARKTAKVLDTRSYGNAVLIGPRGVDTLNDISGKVLLAQGDNISIKPIDSTTLEISSADFKGIEKFTAIPNESSSHGEESIEVSAIKLKAGTNVDIWKSDDDTFEISATGGMAAGVSSFNSYQGAVTLNGINGVKIHDNGEGNFEISSNGGITKFNNYQGEVSIVAGPGLKLYNREGEEGTFEISNLYDRGIQSLNNLTASDISIISSSHIGVHTDPENGHIEISTDLLPGITSLKVGTKTLTGPQITLTGKGGIELIRKTNTIEISARTQGGGGGGSVGGIAQVQTDDGAQTSPDGTNTLYIFGGDNVTTKQNDPSEIEISADVGVKGIQVGGETLDDIVQISAGTNVKVKRIGDSNTIEISAADGKGIQKLTAKGSGASHTQASSSTTSAITFNSGANVDIWRKTSSSFEISAKYNDISYLSTITALSEVTETDQIKVLRDNFNTVLRALQAFYNNNI